MVAEVVINSIAKSLNRVFDYNIPIELEDIVQVGSRVLLSFGNGKKLEEGYVIQIKEKSEYKTKNIIKVEDNLLNKDNIELATLMANRYFCNISECIKLMLPPGTRTKNFEARVKDKTTKVVCLKEEIDKIEFDIENKIIKSEKQIRLLEFLKENDNVTINDIEIFLDVSRAIMNTLIKKGYIELLETKVDRTNFIKKEQKRDQKLKFTNEQQQAYLRIKQAIKDKAFQEFLLYGVTGSRENRDLFTINRRSNC